MAPNTLSAGAPALTPAQLALACARDSQLFAKVWFPKTVRQGPAIGHERIWSVLEDQSARFVNLEASRGFAKTTISRIYTAKRVAYATAHTMLYVSANDDHARRSIMWLRGRIASKNIHTGQLEPTAFAKFYGLVPGAKWNETELEIVHALDGRTIWLQGVGITGNIRGINFDDYRPDYIYCDDILTDENSATKEQRGKISDLVFGALKESLAPRVDEPNAKMVIGQTPHDPDDVCARAKKSNEFVTVSLPCWTQETLNEPLEKQESAWPSRIPTLELRAEKKAAIEENRYSIFAREKECRLVTAETAAFRTEWARRYVQLPGAMYSVLAIDPVPPPSERELAKSLKDKDFEVQLVLGRYKGEYFVQHYDMKKGHEPDWSVTNALALARQYRCSKIVVETVAYQATLKWLLEKEMQRRQIYFVVDAYKDSRKKFARITSALAGPLKQGRLLVAEHMVDLLQQIERYPAVEHDDILDALAIAMSAIMNPYLELEDGGIFEDDVLPEFEPMRLCP